MEEAELGLMQVMLIVLKVVAAEVDGPVRKASQKVPWAPMEAGRVGRDVHLA